MNIKLLQPQAIHQMGKRKNQEDTIFPRLGNATANDRVFLVCDGMGGHEKGEVASITVATAINSFLKKNFNPDEVLSDDILLEAINEAYKRLDEKDDGSFKKMGTTLTLVALHRGGATVAHIGDSRIYHLRPATGEILYKSRDHSLVYELYQAGEITYGEMRTSPQKNVITRAMMPGEDSRTKADIVHITDIKAGDYFYHCSDGMLEQMEDEEILEIFSSDLSDEQKAQRLIDATVDNNDNHSAYILHIDEVTSEPGDDALLNDEATSHCNAIRIERERGKDDVQVIEDDEATQATVDSSTPPTPPPFQPKNAESTGSGDFSPIGEPPAEPKQRRPGRGVPDGFNPNIAPTPPKRKMSKAPVVIAILCLLVIAGLATYMLKPELVGKKPADNKAQTETSVSQNSAAQDAKNELQEDNRPAQPSQEPLREVTKPSSSDRRTTSENNAGKKPNTDSHRKDFNLNRAGKAVKNDYNVGEPKKEETKKEEKKQEPVINTDNPESKRSGTKKHP